MVQRNTKQKDLIYGSLIKLHNHPTADQVYDDIHILEPTVSRATVYRVLNRMAEQGKILKLSVLSGADRFDGTIEDHSHIHCTCCDMIFDIPHIRLDIDEFTKMEMADFEIRGYSLMMEGICPKCQRENKTAV